jgi:hypothetical protein
MQYNPSVSEHQKNTVSASVPEIEGGSSGGGGGETRGKGEREGERVRESTERVRRTEESGLFNPSWSLQTRSVEGTSVGGVEESGVT